MSGSLRIEHTSGGTSVIVEVPAEPIPPVEAAKVALGILRTRPPTSSPIAHADAKRAMSYIALAERFIEDFQKRVESLESDHPDRVPCERVVESFNKYLELCRAQQ